MKKTIRQKIEEDFNNQYTPFDEHIKTCIIELEYLKEKLTTTRNDLAFLEQHNDRLVKILDNYKKLANDYQKGDFN